MIIFCRIPSTYERLGASTLSPNSSGSGGTEFIDPSPIAPSSNGTDFTDVDEVPDQNDRNPVPNRANTLYKSPVALNPDLKVPNTVIVMAQDPHVADVSDSFTLPTTRRSRYQAGPFLTKTTHLNL